MSRSAIAEISMQRLRAALGWETVECLRKQGNGRVPRHGYAV